MKQYLALGLVALISACSPQTEKVEKKVEKAKEPLKEYCKMEAESFTHISKALGINSYHGELYTDKTTMHDGMVLQFYKDGKLQQTVNGGYANYEEPKEIGKKQFAIHIIDKSTLPIISKAPSDYRITAGYGSGSFNIDLPKSNFSLEAGSSYRTINDFIVRDGLMPIFYILEVPTDTAFSPDGSIDDVIKKNPKASIIVGSLKVVDKGKVSPSSKSTVTK